MALIQHQNIFNSQKTRQLGIGKFWCCAGDPLGSDIEEPDWTMFTGVVALEEES